MITLFNVTKMIKIIKMISWRRSCTGNERRSGASAPIGLRPITVQLVIGNSANHVSADRSHMWKQCRDNNGPICPFVFVLLFRFYLSHHPLCICPIVLGLADRIKNDPAKDVFSHRRLLLGERVRKTADIGKRPKPEDFVLLCFRRRTWFKHICAKRNEFNKKYLALWRRLHSLILVQQSKDFKSSIFRMFYIPTFQTFQHFHYPPIIAGLCKKSPVAVIHRTWLQQKSRDQRVRPTD